MSTVKRRLFNVLAVVSLVLCVATAAVWTRSHWRGDQIIWARSGYGYLRMRTVPGAIRIDLVRGAGYTNGFLRTSDPVGDAAPGEAFWIHHGKSVGTSSPAWEEWAVAFPWSV